MINNTPLHANTYEYIFYFKVTGILNMLKSDIQLTNLWQCARCGLAS